MSSKEAGHIIQGLAQQVQLLASLYWLSSLQVLACIPQQQSVPIQDVAEISGVPIDQLIRSIRMATTAGFLRESVPGYVEHTPLSIQFVQKPYLSDAVSFLCDVALPAAMQMGKVTRLQLQSPNIKQCAYSLVSQTSMTLGADCERQPKLRRQVEAYDRLRSQSAENGATEVLSSLDWSALGEATVVQVGPPSTLTASTLASCYQNLRFVVQVPDQDGPNTNWKPPTTFHPQIPPHVASRVTTQLRSRGAPQSVKNGSVYILHFHDMLLSVSQELWMEVMSSEVRVHFDVLRANRDASLVIVAQVLPEPGVTNNQAESAARSEGLLMMQMTNHEMPGMATLQQLLESVNDGSARLKILNKLFSRQGPVVALQVRLEENPQDRQQAQILNPISTLSAMSQRVG